MNTSIISISNEFKRPFKIIYLQAPHEVSVRFFENLGNNWRTLLAIFLTVRRFDFPCLS